MNHPPSTQAAEAFPKARSRVLAGFAVLCCVLRLGGMALSVAAGPTWMVVYQAASAAFYLVLLLVVLRGHRGLFLALLGPESLVWAVATILAYGFGASFWLFSVVIAIGIMLLLHDLALRLRIALLVTPLPLAFPVAMLVGGDAPQVELSPDLMLYLPLANELGCVAILSVVTGLAIRDHARAREQAHRMALERARLIEDLSHEVRTPIATALMAAQGAQALPDVPAPVERHLEWVESAARAATRLVERMLELASLDRTGEDEPDLCELRQAIDEAAQRMRPMARSAGVELHVEQSGSNSREIDRVSLDIVLHNLVSNAITHSASGDCVVIRVVDRDMGVQLEVEDEGEGIAPSDLPFVFDRLWRADRARSRAAGRFGLGLAIAQRHAERLGSEIRVESTVGDGSRFWLVLN